MHIDGWTQLVFFLPPLPSPPDEVLVVKDEGMPRHSNTARRGNLHVRFVVDFPPTLSEAQKAGKFDFFSKRFFMTLLMFQRSSLQDLPPFCRDLQSSTCLKKVAVFSKRPIHFFERLAFFPPPRVPCRWGLLPQWAFSSSRACLTCFIVSSSFLCLA